ncbi:TPA: hypothetical protein I7682_18065 [Vibrio vulnificus]|nr:hypothetical protein [Vibrio vulnificus]
MIKLFINAAGLTRESALAAVKDLLDNNGHASPTINAIAAWDEALTGGHDIVVEVNENRFRFLNVPRLKNVIFPCENYKDDHHFTEEVLNVLSLNGLTPSLMGYELINHQPNVGKVFRLKTHFLG